MTEETKTLARVDTMGIVHRILTAPTDGGDV